MPQPSNISMTRVGNQTNSVDPVSVESRIFVGNLNTFLVSKDDVERIFQRYGRIIAISMHKGYAFVQYLDTWDARNAVVGEDGRTVAGQVLDVNMVSEPKPHQLGRKRQNNFSTDELESLLSSANSSLDRPTTGPRKNRFMSPKQNVPPPMKKARTEVPARSLKHRSPYKSFLSHDGDILICGNCKEVMTGLPKFFEHKRQGCKLRFSCRCHQAGGAPSKPTCSRCGAVLRSWWELSQHVQTAHDVSVYLNPDTDQNSSTEDFSQTDQLTPTSSINNEEAKTDSDWDMELLHHLDNGTVENGGTSNTQDNAPSPTPEMEEKGVDTADLGGTPEEG